MPAIAITDLPALGRAPEGADRVPVEGRTTTLGAIFDALGAGATQIVTESPAAVSARDVVLDDDGHTAETPGVLTLPRIRVGARHTIWTPYDSVFYSVTPHPDDVGVSISGGSSYLIDSQLMRSVAYDVIAVETSEGLTWLIDNGAERVINEGIYPTLIDHEARIEAAEGDIDALETDVGTLTTSLASTASELSTTIGRVSSLEAPTSVDENGAAISWTTQKRIRNIHAAALAVFTLDATTGQWPIGEARPLANFSTAAHGIRVNVPSGHYLNGILNGTTGTLGAAAAVAGSPIYTILVTREDTDRWSWA